MNGERALDARNLPEDPAKPAIPLRSRLLKYQEAADVLGVTDRTVFTMVKTGVLPSVRFGGSVRIDPRDLDAFISQSKRKNAGGDS